jgi:ATP-dependent DNA helicase RecG
MSATPIPRSLSFAVYGKIDISMIKTKPSGRKKVTTSIISIKKIDDLINGIRRKISKNEQVFWILPHIGNEEGENESEKETVISRYEFIKKVFKNIVGVIHGRMSDDEIKKTMNDFKNKKKMILISTTMIEVGINIPDATLMIIEEANRFGLAQLHQLRGRITRGNLPSNCVLIHNKGLSENSLKRLLILKNSDDGFEIAEKDMFLRGSGDFFGTNQSGSSNWKFFEPYNDIDMINNVKINYNYLISQEIENKEKIEFLIRIFYGKKEFLNYSSA